MSFITDIYISATIIYSNNMVSPVTNHFGVAYTIQLWGHIQDGFQVGWQPWKIDANGPFTDDLLSEFPFQMVVFDSKLLDCSEGNLNISSLLN
jgi:hypothetical protein